MSDEVSNTSLALIAYFKHIQTINIAALLILLTFFSIDTVRKPFQYHILFSVRFYLSWSFNISDRQVGRSISPTTNICYNYNENKVCFVNIMMAGRTQKKLKSYISSTVPFQKRKRKTSMQESIVKIMKKLWKED